MTESTMVALLNGNCSAQQLPVCFGRVCSSSSPRLMNSLRKLHAARCATTRQFTSRLPLRPRNSRERNSEGDGELEADI
jgi:hypothetical protein